LQINIDKKSGIFISVIALLLIIFIGMGMSGRSNDGFFGMHHNDADMMDENYFNSSGDLTGSDIMFFQMMIPHHQQAVEISDLALARSKDPELLALARQIRDGQASEIITMKAWLDAANAGLDMGHHMDDSMGGMLGDAELADLKAASGKNFDLLWLSGMTEHHDGALHMTTMIRDSGKAQIKTFGEAIVIAQSKQITQMAAMMKRMG
jgi:uncharacterized protein (DUF305 family)